MMWTIVYLLGSLVGAVVLLVFAATLYTYLVDDFNNVVIDSKGGGIPGFSFTRAMLSLIGSQCLRTVGVKSKALPPCHMKFKNAAVQLETLFQIWKVRRTTQRESADGSTTTKRHHNESTEEVPFLYFEMTLFPQIVRYMSHPSFPLQAMGAVHYRNETKQHCAMPLKDTYDLTVCASDMGIPTKQESIGCIHLFQANVTDILDRHNTS
eukprot:gb/GECG01015554.1/.p1 GENE.gb/GECG01015554.1/~~gb/GECG01015554.1/.p1  ORF type:complete len:209 (+),score=17.43 gb/GECG01015554.1/:1-627(+)